VVFKEAGPFLALWNARLFEEYNGGNNGALEGYVGKFLFFTLRTLNLTEVFPIYSGDPWMRTRLGGV
jgi:hypothetical protein